MIVINMGALAPINLKKVFFIVGPAGSGKTTAAQLVTFKNPERIDHYSVGDLLRAEAQKDTERGRMIKQMVDTAQIVPLGVGMDVVKRAVIASSKDIILFDGFPPTIEYATAFEGLTKENTTIKLMGAIEIFLDEATARERILKRNRADDAAAIFQMRYKRYMQNAQELNPWYKNSYLFISIDGNQPLDVIVELVEGQIL